MGRRRCGQVLVLFAVLIPVLLLFFLFALGLAALEDVRAHVSYALGVATRAGVQEIEYAAYGWGDPQFNAHVVSTTQEVFLEGLRLRPAGLGEPPEYIATALTDVAIVAAVPGTCQASPFPPHTEHCRPTVAAQARVPIRVWMFQVTVAVLSETEVR